MTKPNSSLGLWTAPAKIKPVYKWLIFAFFLAAYLATGRWMLVRWGELSRVFVFLFAIPAAFFGDCGAGSSSPWSRRFS